jgi:hypothetical protein
MGEMRQNIVIEPEVMNADQVHKKSPAQMNVLKIYHRNGVKNGKNN